MVTSGKQLHVQVHTCSGLDVAELLLLLQDPGLGRVRVTSASGASCSAVRWHLATGGCVSPKVALPSGKFGRAVCRKVTPLQTDQAEMEVEVTMCEASNEEGRDTVPFSVHHLAKQHMDQDIYIQEA